MSPSNLHLAWARLFLRGLAAAGVEQLVLSPGSRSTPLALAAAGERGLSVRVVVDERAAAFFALGQVRITGRPTALVCTSGTAPAHWFPAVIEASQQHLPLLLVSADRPWESQGVAAPQTIDQVKLFGGFVREAIELGEPHPAALRAVPGIAARGVHRSLSPVPGPVHVNARFRKPLEPVDVAGPEPWEPVVTELLAAGVTRALPAVAAPDPAAVESLARALARARRGLVVCGPAQLPCDPAEAAAAVAELSRATGFPVLAEATSGVRFAVPAGASDGAAPPFVGAIEPLLAARSFLEAHLPDCLIEVGGPPVSAAYGRFVEAHPEVPRYVLAGHGWCDPWGGAASMSVGDPVALALAVARRRRELPGERDASWGAAWARADGVVRELIDTELSDPELTEGAVARLLVESLPRGAVLVAGNSGPLRDLDLYCPPADRGLAVLHQRGANGIDGLVAGAAGAATVAGAPTALLLGDLSLLHDLGGLATARALPVPLAVVVVQNQGGRIFEALPVGRRPELAEVVERHFVVPQRVDLAAAAAAFGHGYARADGPGELAAALSTALEHRGCTVIEAVVPPRDGNARKRRIAAAAARALERPGPLPGGEP